MSSRPGWRSAIRAVLALAMILAAQHAMAQTIRMWTFLKPTGTTGREIVLKKLIDGFEAAHPGVKVVVEPQDYRTLSQKFFAAHQTGTAPDVVWLFSPTVWGAVKLGALANFDEMFLKSWSKADLDDVDGPLWRYGGSEHAHYQFLLSRTMHGIFYRSDWMKAAGIDPKTLTTWDKFIAAAQKLTARDATGNVTHWGFGQGLAGGLPLSPVVFNVLMDKDGTIFDKNFHAAWATPAGIQGLQMEVDMIQKYKISPPDAISVGEDDLDSQFNAGHLAMFRGGSARLQAEAAAVGPENLGYLASPSFTEGKNSPSGTTGWSIAVWSGSKVKDLAGQFVEYMTNRDADWQWTSVAGQLPIRKSTVTDHAAFFADPKNAALAAAAKDLAENGWVPPEQAGEGGWNDGLDAAAQDVITHGTDPKTALEKAEVAYNRSHR